MNNEIKEIIARLERIDHKEYSCAFEFADSATFDEMARCFEERKKMADYITNLQEENERLKEDMKIKDDIISINYNKDTKEYILDRKNYYKINKRLNERLDYKSRNEKAINKIKIKIVREFNENDYMINTDDIIEILNILNGGDKDAKN